MARAVAAGHVVEFAGEAVAALDMEARMTLCNMATEFSAMTAMIAPDAKTFEYLAGRTYAPANFDDPYWATLSSDKGAEFDREIIIEACPDRTNGELGHQSGAHGCGGCSSANGARACARLYGAGRGRAARRDPA